MAKTDENREYVSLASNGSQAVPIKVDPATDRLLIEIHYLAEASRTINSAEIDENRKATDLVVDDSGVIKPLLIDNRNGYLLVDILEEGD